MLIIDQNLVSEDVIEKRFVCDLEKCKGACCVEGDLGAPLLIEEIDVIKEVYSAVKPYLSEEGIAAIEEQGTYVEDWEDEYSTPTIGDKECAYAIYDETGCLKCGIEAAYNDKKIDFKKPISCHLYPIRLSQVGEFVSLNYDKWSICSDACKLGDQLGVEIYKFLKEPLIRAFGEEWYEKLVKDVEGEEK